MKNNLDDHSADTETKHVVDISNKEVINGQSEQHDDLVQKEANKQTTNIVLDQAQQDQMNSNASSKGNNFNGATDKDHLYAEIEGANYENIAWLRNLGAALIAINGVGALLAIKDPQKELKLYDVVLLASSLETIGLIWSTIKWEFSATNEWFIKAPMLLAALVTILLIIYRPSRNLNT